MTGDQLVLLAVISTLALPALMLGAGRAFMRHGLEGKTTCYIGAYVATLFSVVLLSVVVHLLPRLPAIWQSL